MCPFGDETLRRRKADPAAAGGDDSNLALKPVHLENLGTSTTSGSSVG
jgi:hypothetical protein